MIRSMLIALLYLVGLFSIFAFAAKFGRLTLYAHMVLLLLMAVWIVTVVLEGTSAIRKGWCDGRSSCVRLLACVALLPIMALVGQFGRSYREHLFDKRLPAYMSVVRQAEDGLALDNNRWSRLTLPPGVDEVALLAMGRRTRDGVAVKFLVSGNLPARHFGYIYLPNVTNDVPSLLPRIHRRMATEGWYEFYD